MSLFGRLGTTRGEGSNSKRAPKLEDLQRVGCLASIYPTAATFQKNALRVRWTIFLKGGICDSRVFGEVGEPVRSPTTFAAHLKGDLSRLSKA